MRTIAKQFLRFSGFFVIFLIFTIPVFSQNGGGPDAYGYGWRSSAATNGPTAEWHDLTDATKWKGVLDFSDKFDDDNFFGPLNFSFEFPYYWYTRNELYIGSNGYVSFNPQNISAGFPSIPQIGGKGDDYLAPFLADLTGGGDINASKFLFYTDFKDTVIISFEDIPWFNPGGGPTGANTFQVVLSRPDSSITFNYGGQSGGPSNSQTADFLSIGIENVSGRVGIQQSRDLQSIQMFPVGMSRANPFSIKFYKPATSDYSTKDLRVLWNSKKGTQGVFAAMGGEDRDAVTNIFNQGLEPGPKSILQGEVKIGNTVIGEVNTFTRPIEPGQNDLFKFNGVKIPLDETGVVTFKTTLNYPDDDVKNNNTITHMTTVVDTSLAELELRHDDKGRNGGLSFVGASNFSAGIGTYIEPPYYPVKITAVTVNLSSASASAPPGGPARLEVYDDDGLNLAGERDGSPGTLLFQGDIAAGVAGENRIEIPDGGVQLNSGGVFIGALQGATTVYIGTDNTAPHSFTSFEVINGEFVPFRNRNTEDAMIGIVISKGDVTLVEDLAVTKIISPDSATDYSEAVPMTVELSNLSGVDISGPFEISYSVNSRQEVFDTIPETFVISAGATAEYTFKNTTARPPAPKTKFDSVCVKSYLTNDFVPSNNQLCYKTKSKVGFDTEIPGFSLFPNPTSSIVNLELRVINENDVQFELFSNDGKLLLSKNFGKQTLGNTNLKLNLPNIPTGIYAYKVTNGEKSQRGLLAVTSR